MAQLFWVDTYTFAIFFGGGDSPYALFHTTDKQYNGTNDSVAYVEDLVVLDDMDYDQPARKPDRWFCATHTDWKCCIVQSSVSSNTAVGPARRNNNKKTTTKNRI